MYIVLRSVLTQSLLRKRKNLAITKRLWIFPTHDQQPSSSNLAFAAIRSSPTRLGEYNPDSIVKRVGRFPVERSLRPRSIDRTEDERNFVKTLNTRYVTRYKILLSWKSKPTLFTNISFWIFHLQSKNPRKFFSSPKLIQNSFRS